MAEPDASKGDVQLELVEDPTTSSQHVLLPKNEEDYWKMDIQKLKKAKIAPEDLKRMPPKLRRFYKRHNRMLDNFEKTEGGGPQEDQENEEKAAGLVKAAIYVSFAVNVILFILNVFNAIKSRSLSVLAAAIDSFLDILSGSLIWITAEIRDRARPWDYPAGKSRFEPLGMIVFSSVMFTATLQLLLEGVKKMIDVYGSHKSSNLKFTPMNYAIIGVGVASKLLLWLWCRTIPNSLSARTLAADHLNDVVMNACGTMFAVAGFYTIKYTDLMKGGWIDPMGAIAIALFVMQNWGRTCWQYVKLLSGRAASPEFLSTVTYLCWNHDKNIIQIDTVRAFRLAEGYIVEVDVVLPKEMPLHQAHDIGEALQFRIEDLDEVERAFVHLDFETGHKPEH